MNAALSQPILPAAPRGVHAVVVGGGTMGADVAIVLARGGARVSVTEPQASQRQALAQRVQAALAGLLIAREAVELSHEKRLRFVIQSTCRFIEN